MNGFPAVELKQATQTNLGHPTFVRRQEFRAEGDSVEGGQPNAVAAMSGRDWAS